MESETETSVVVNRRKLGVRGVIRELALARRAGPVPETVFRLFRPFHGPKFGAIYERVMADETGRRILREGRSLHPVLLDFDRLRSPSAGALGRHYVGFMEANQIDIVSFAEASLRHMAREDYANAEAWTLANRLRDIHEIVHVISGQGTDVLGEMCEIAFNIREDPRPRAARFAIRSNVASFRRHGYRHGEAAIRQAFQRGRRVRLMVGADWESMMDWQLDDVRMRLGISKPPSYDPIPPTDEAPAPIDLIRAAFRCGIDLLFGIRTVIDKQVTDPGIAQDLFAQSPNRVQQILPGQDIAAFVDRSDAVGCQRDLDTHHSSVPHQPVGAPH